MYKSRETILLIYGIIASRIIVVTPAPLETCGGILSRLKPNLGLAYIET
jgi:hypothetical protein